MPWGMTMTDDDKINTELDTLFQQARAAPAQMPEGLMARVLADADALQPAAVRLRWQVLLRALGGAPGVGGLITAGCFGFWLGVAPPASLPDLAGTVLGFEATLDAEIEGGTLTAFGWDIEES